MGVARVYQAGSPYNAVELDELDYAQTADTMYLAHIDRIPNKLVRSAHSEWTFSDLTFGPNLVAPTAVGAVAANPNTDADNGGDAYFPQPATYIVTSIDDETGEESRASSSTSAINDLTLKRNFNTITWAAASGATRYNVYKADNSQFFGYIGTTDSLTFRDDNIGPALDRAPPEARNPFDSTNNYPSTVSLFEQRSFWGRTNTVPNGVWASRTGFLENFDRSQPARADDSLELAIQSGQVNAVNQLVSTVSLLALTTDSVARIDGDGSGGVITADSPPAARRQVGRGASRVKSLVIDNVVFYLPLLNSSVRTVNYSFEIEGLRSNDVSIYSPHFFEQFEIVEWCYSQEPRSLIWALRNDGKLLCFTWEQEQNVWGWTLCETDGVVRSLCCITESGEDRVYIIVDRVIGGQTRRFVERMVSHTFSSLENSCFMDSAITQVFSTPQSTFSGLWHLEGRTDVVALVDGVPTTGLTVTNGSVTIPDTVPAGRTVSVGLPYQVDVETLPIRASLQGSGSNLGRRQQTGDTVLSLENTGLIEAGIDADHLNIVKQRTSEAYGEATQLISGETDPITMDNRAGTDASVYIRQTLPLPFTMLGVAMEPVVDG